MKRRRARRTKQGMGEEGSRPRKRAFLSLRVKARGLKAISNTRTANILMRRV